MIEMINELTIILIGSVNGFQGTVVRRDYDRICPCHYDQHRDDHVRITDDFHAGLSDDNLDHLH